MSEANNQEPIPWVVDDRLPCDIQTAQKISGYGLADLIGQSSVTRNNDGHIDSILRTAGHHIFAICSQSYFDNL